MRYADIYIMRVKNFLRDCFIVLGVLILSGGIMYGIMLYQQHGTVLGSQTVSDSVLDRVGKLIELPQEIPTIATVSDVHKLQDKQFFFKAKNGDNLLIFNQANEAILYRPSENKIIQVSPVTMQH